MFHMILSSPRTRQSEAPYSGRPEPSLLIVTNFRRAPEFTTAGTLMTVPITSPPTGAAGAAGANPLETTLFTATLLDATLFTAVPPDVMVCVEAVVWLDHDPETAGTGGASTGGIDISGTGIWETGTSGTGIWETAGATGAGCGTYPVSAAAVSATAFSTTGGAVGPAGGADVYVGV